jgi:hypothetical protein
MNACTVFPDCGPLSGDELGLLSMSGEEFGLLALLVVDKLCRVTDGSLSDPGDADKAVEQSLEAASINLLPSSG